MAKPAAPQQCSNELAECVHYNSRELAKLWHLSPRQSRRRCMRLVGRPPQHWLDEQRLAAAKERLASGQPVKEIALSLGFTQSSNFCRHFKLHIHMTPSQFATANSSAISGMAAQTGPAEPCF